jgi:hypothetical protein
VRGDRPSVRLLGVRAHFLGPAHRDLLPDGVGQEKDGPGEVWADPKAALEHVSHVLDAHSSHYEELLADPKVVDEQLLACRCSRCSAPGPRLTGSRVSRKLHALPAFKVCSIALAVCLRCDRRERVLPCDALPGKVAGAEIVMDAVGDARHHAARRGIVPPSRPAVPEHSPQHVQFRWFLPGEPGYWRRSNWSGRAS